MSVYSFLLSVAGLGALVLLTVTGDVDGNVTVPLIAALLGVGGGRVVEAKRNGA